MSDTINLVLEGRTYEVNLTAIEEAFLNKGLSNLSKIPQLQNPMANMAIKGVLSMLGIHKPKEFEGMDTIEFLARVCVSEAISSLSGSTIPIPCKEVIEEIKEEVKENEQ